MYLDYSKFIADTDGTPIVPELRLQTLSGKNFGTLRGVHDLKFTLNFSELSEISFTVPYMDGGILNPLYNKIEGYKVLWTKNHGIYLLTTPTTTGSGLEEAKSVKGYSLEKKFERKKLFLAEGTYNFYDPFNPQDTILGRLLELDSDWEIGHVDVSLIGRYRTFPKYDSNALSFIYGDMMTKFRCVAVFDTYKNPETGKRRINIYDADADISTIPIYLSYDNLVEQTEVTQLSDELITKLSVYGADDLSIREVNPIGSDYIINLDYFIQNGDIEPTLATRYYNWLAQASATREYYSGLVALRASATAKKIALQAELADLKGELETLTSQQSITIQTLASETTDQGKATQQELLNQINADINDKKNEITAKEKEIENESAIIDDYASDIKSVNDDLAYVNYFTPEEQTVLDRYLIEETVVESTFVASDIDTTVSGKTSTITGSIKISDSDISEIDMTDLYSKKMYMLTGGKVLIESAELSAYIIRGTLEIKNSTNEYICSLYLGTCVYGNTTHPSGLFTISGTLSEFSSDIKTVDDNGLSLRQGTSVSFNATNASAFLSANVSDYQKYSVSQELYDFGQEILSEKAIPTYEFTVDAANFLYQSEFEPFKNRLKFGDGIYLMLGSMGRIVATFIGMELDYGSESSIGLTFANRFQKHDGKTYLKELLEKSYSSSRSFDASKYIYNQATSKTSQVSEFMKQSINSAVNTIIGASNQSVIINGAGIHVGGDDDCQLRIVDKMIAISDDNWNTAKVAIGMFSSEALGTYFGVNADVIAGKLLIGNNLVIENINDDGVMQFKVDSSGAWINNGTIVMQKDNGGQILLDPRYGIAAGKSGLFTTNGTTVSPSFVNNGEVTLDDDGINFYLDMNTGAAYFRGTLNATAGEIGGFTIKDDYLYAGTGSSYVALNGSGTNSNSAYAFWAGNSNPTSAKFYVKKDGTVSASGTINAEDLKIKGTSVLSGNNINGAYIADGTITADKIKANSISTDKLVVGTIPDVPTKVSQLENDKGYQNYSGVTTIVDGYITADRINAIDIIAKYLKGETVYLLDSSERSIGGIQLVYTSTGTGLSMYTNSNRGGIKIEANGGNLFLSTQEINGSSGPQMTLGIVDNVLNPICSLKGGALVIDSRSYGSESGMPAYPIEGQVYFVLQ